MAHHTDAKLVTREDVRGRLAISYQRFSSAGQRHGSSIDRQDDIYEETCRDFILKPFEVIRDKKISGWTGKNRHIGQLKNLLQRAKDKEFPVGTLLVVEEMHRLSREHPNEVYKILGLILDAGLLLLVAARKKIWCRARMATSEAHELLADILAAHEYSRGISNRGLYAQAKRRAKMAEGRPVGGKAIHMNGRTPGWITRTRTPEGKPDDYILNEHANTIIRVFTLANGGMTVHAITFLLNSEKVPTMSGTGAWRYPRIAAILKDRHVLGFHTAIRRGENGSSEKLTGEHRVYPQLIDDVLFMSVQDRDKANKGALPGQRMASINNLFPRKVICKTCKGPMRTETGGGIRKGKRKRDFQCASFIESKVCRDNTRYDVFEFEPKILQALIRHSEIAPRTRPKDISKIETDIAAKRIELEGLNKIADYLLSKVADPDAAVGAYNMEQHALQVVKILKAREQLESLKAKQMAEEHKVSRHHETVQFLKSVVTPALAGKVVERGQLRGLIAGLNFKVVGTADGGMNFEMGRRQEHLPSADFDALIAARDIAHENEATDAAHEREREWVVLS